MKLDILDPSHKPNPVHSPLYPPPSPLHLFMLTSKCHLLSQLLSEKTFTVHFWEPETIIDINILLDMFSDFKVPTKVFLFATPLTFIYVDFKQKLVKGKLKTQTCPRASLKNSIYILLLLHLHFYTLGICN